MKKTILIAAAATILGVAAFVCGNSMRADRELSALQLENIEALSQQGESLKYGCGMAAYEWDNDWYEDTKTFSQCRQGCPTVRGTSPLYVQCD